MFNRRSTISACAAFNARVATYVVFTAAAMTALMFSAATAVAQPELFAGVNPPAAMSAPEITTGIKAVSFNWNDCRADSLGKEEFQRGENPDFESDGSCNQGEIMTINEAMIRMPDGWKARNPANVQRCPLNGFKARNCGENTVIGDIEAFAQIGGFQTRAVGKVHLLESNADNEPLKIGFLADAMVNGGPIPLVAPFVANIVLEPADGGVNDRITVKFKKDDRNDPDDLGMPELPVKYFEIKLNSGGGDSGIVGTGAFNHLLGNEQCGVKAFEGTVEVEGEAAGPVSSNVNINRNCDPFAVVNAMGQGQPSPFRPRLSVRSALAEHSDVTFEIDGAINDGASDYHSLKAASLNFPVSSDVNLNAVPRCNAAGANCPAGSVVGSTSMEVAAAGQSHNVEGNVYLTNGGLRLTYTNTPVRLNNRAPIVIDATLQQIVRREGFERYRITVGDHSDADAAGFPTTYEIKRWSLTLDGDAGGNFLTHDRAQCDVDESDRKERYRVFADKKGAFTSTFSSDYGLPYWPRTVRCGSLGRQKSKPITEKPIDGKSDGKKSEGSKSEGSKSEKSQSAGSKSKGKAGRVKSKAGKTRTVAFRK